MIIVDHVPLALSWEVTEFEEAIEHFEMFSKRRFYYVGVQRQSHLM